MNKLLRRISNLFTDTDGKISRVEEIQSKLSEISVIKDTAAMQWQDISKAVGISDEAKDREISYIKYISGISKLEKALLDELHSLESDEGVKGFLVKVNRVRARNIIKSLYRSGRLKLDQYNHAAGVKDENGAIKYADVIVINKDGDFLVLKRSIFEDNHQGAWVIPGGHVDEDEEFEDAAKRELLEESGLSVDKMCDEKVPHEFVHVGTYNDGKAHIEYYRLALFTEQYPELLLDEAETRDYRWVKPVDIDEYEMVFNMRDNIKKVMGWDNYPNVKVIRKAIEKGIVPIDKVNDIVNRIEDIEKAIKDKSKLKRIKKFVTREGKTFLQTFYVKTGQQEEKEIEEKYLKGILDEVMNAEVGERYKIKTKLKEVEGLLTDIFYDYQSDSYFLITVDDSNGKLVYSKFSAIKSISKVEEKVDSGYGVGFEFVKNLGGSTGAVLVKDTGTGELWVAKRGASKEHIQSEYEALQLYRDLEARVPDHFMKDGVLYTSFKEGYKFEELTGIAAEGFKRDLGSYFLVDCLLGNWDVVGMECDNVVYTSDGCYRVDVGGSLAYRAQGQLKSEWGEQVTEIDNMRNPEINPTAAKVFGHLTDKDLYDQFKFIDDKRPSDGFSNPVVESRFQWLKKELQHRYIVLLNDSFKEIAVEQLYDVPDYLPDSIKEFYKEVDELMKVTIKDIEDCSKLTDKTTRCLLDDDVAKSNLEFKEGVLNDFRKMGLSYREIFAINRFTSGSYDSINESLVNMSNGKFGNIAFKEDGLVISNMLLENEGSGKSKTGKVNELKNELTGVLEILAKAAKTINFHHEAGDINYNKETIAVFFDKMDLVSNLNKNKNYKNKPISDIELKAVNKLNKMFADIGKVISNSESGMDINKKKIGYIDSSLTEINDIPYYSKEEITVKKGSKLVKEHKGGSSKFNFIDVLTAKLATSGLTKIERSGNSNYLARGQTLRKISVDLDDFTKQHQYGNLVTHCRASSSKKQEVNTWSGNVQMVIVGNPTAYVQAISEHPGENEALHKPFSLFECGSKFKNDNGNFTNFILRKVI